MEMVMKNLDLVLTKVDQELKNHSVRESKTLMNTYCNLLRQFDYKFNPYDPKHNEYINKHKEKLSELLKFGHKEIAEYLNDKEYKFADDMVMIVQRIENSIADIKRMLNKLNKFNSLPQTLR